MLRFFCDGEWRHALCFKSLIAYLIQYILGFKLIHYSFLGKLIYCFVLIVLSWSQMFTLMLIIEMT